MTSTDTGLYVTGTAPTQVGIDASGKPTYTTDPTGGNSVLNGNTPSFASTPITSSLFAQPTPAKFVSPTPTPTPQTSTVVDTLRQNYLDSFAPTQGQNDQSATIKELQNIGNQLAGKSAYQTGLEQEAGYTVDKNGVQQNAVTTDLLNQLDQLTAQQKGLQNDYNYTIPNKITNDFTGRASVRDQSGLTDQARRSNQIQQGEIATKSLTVSALLAGQQQKLGFAKSLIDQAVKAKYGDLEARQAALEYNLKLQQQDPNNTVEQNKKIAEQQDLLDQRNAEITKQKENFTAVHTMATTAIANNPNNQQAQLAAQQVLGLDPKDSQYLQKAFALVGQYQKDPAAVQKAIDDHLLAQSNITKNNIDIRNAAIGSGAGANDPIVQGWVSAIKDGKAKLSDITTADLKKNPNLKSSVIQALSSGGTSQSEILQITKASLDELNQMVKDNHGFTGAVGFRGPIGTFSGPISGTNSASFAAKAGQVVNDIVLPNLTLLHGLGRVTDREFQALQSSITSLHINGDKESRFYGTSPLSEADFKTELKNITDRIDKKIAEKDTSTDQYASQRSQLKSGEILITRNGQVGSIPSGEFNSKTDKKL